MGRWSRGVSATLTLIERMEREAHAPSDDASNGNQNRQLNKEVPGKGAQDPLLQRLLDTTENV